MRRALVFLLLVVAVGGCQRTAGMRLGHVSNDDLIANISGNDPDLKRGSILELADRRAGKSDTALELFTEVLKADTSPFVRSAAVTALGIGENVAYIDPVIGALEDPSPVVRWDAAKSLDTLVAPQALDPLMRHAISDPSLDVRLACIDAMRNHREPDTVRVLAALLDDPELSIRHEAHRSLVEILGVDLGDRSWDWADAHTRPIPQEGEQEKSWWGRMKDRMNGDDQPDTPDEES
jgi:hypothetical protein